jgi:hypothetical protein
MDRRIDAHIARTQFGQIMGTSLPKTMSASLSTGAASRPSSS